MNFLRATGTAGMASAQVVCKNGAASAFARLTVEGHRGSFAVEWVVTALYGRATVREQHNQHQTELVGTSDRHNFSSFHTKPCLLTPPCTKYRALAKGGRSPWQCCACANARLMGVGLVTMCVRVRVRVVVLKTTLLRKRKTKDPLISLPQNCRLVTRAQTGYFTHKLFCTVWDRPRWRLSAVLLFSCCFWRFLWRPAASRLEQTSEISPAPSFPSPTTRSAWVT